MPAAHTVRDDPFDGRTHAAIVGFGTFLGAACRSPITCSSFSSDHTSPTSWLLLAVGDDAAII